MYNTTLKNVPDISFETELRSEYLAQYIDKTVLYKELFARGQLASNIPVLNLISYKISVYVPVKDAHPFWLNRGL